MSLATSLEDAVADARPLQWKYPGLPGPRDCQRVTDLANVAD
jgi:hypothetical protein